MIKCLVGLGNPAGYELTRHNVGMLYLDSLNNHWTSIPEGEESRFNNWVLFKPRAFMNLCGSSVKKYMTRQRLFPEDILVVHDDLELALGKAKLKLEGSAAGHNGVRSLINTLGCKSFKRLRIGIGRPSGSDVSDFVLSTFTRVEMDIVESISFPLCTELIFKSFSLK